MDLCTTSLESLATTHRGWNAKTEQSYRSPHHLLDARERTVTSTPRSPRSATSTQPALTETQLQENAAPVLSGVRPSLPAPPPPVQEARVRGRCGPRVHLPQHQ